MVRARLLLPCLIANLLAAVEDHGAQPWGPSAPGRTVDAQGALVVDADGPQRVVLGRMLRPPLRRPRFALAGRARWQGVGGQAQLELHVQYADGMDCVVRTQDDAGPLAPFSGSGERGLLLPFDGTALGVQPVALELALVLPEGGTFALEPLRLLAFAPDEAFTDRPGGWWGARPAALVAGAAGLVLGAAAMAGAWLVRRRRALRLVAAGAGAAAGLGAAGAVLGVVALVRGQPLAVWLLLISAGGLVALVAGAVLAGLRRRA